MSIKWLFRYIYSGLIYLIYPVGDCIVLPVVKCCMLYLTEYIEVCHALNPTAENNRKQWNHTAKLSCNTISCNHFLNL